MFYLCFTGRSELLKKYGKTGNEKWLVLGHATFNFKSQEGIVRNCYLTALRCGYKTKISWKSSPKNLDLIGEKMQAEQNKGVLLKYFYFIAL